MQGDHASRTFYVAAGGHDTWSGTLAAPNRAGDDGPFASLEGARDAIRRAKSAGALDGPVDVLVRGGTYRLGVPLVFEPEDSGAAGAPVTYRAYAGEAPIISGGRPITGWKNNGDRWSVHLPEVESGTWQFSALWVNGERRTVARMPDEGYFYTRNPLPPALNPGRVKYPVQTSKGFYFAPGDIQRWENLEGALVVVYHSWETSAHRIAAIDDEAHYVTFTGGACWNFEEGGACQRYHVENVFEALDRPGEWYLDRKTGVLYYWPLDGEDLTRAEVIAPVAKQLVLLEGRPAEGAFVEHLRLEGLRFYHTEYGIGPEGKSDGQAAHSVPGAIHAEGARFCAVEQCEVAHVGTYGIHFETGCQDNRIVHCELRDLGAGGVRIGDGWGGDPAAPTVRNLIDNNFIHDGGRIFRSGVGIWIGHASYNTVSHNEICDLFYSGMSVGWVWGYGVSAAHHNIIEYNHIHHIGKGVLSDMGGIYTLGVSPGTIERYNLIHDVHCYSYGGWGLYPDEGSSDILFENNVVYNTSTGGYHQHYGKNNRVRNNIFAFSLNDQLVLSRVEDHLSMVFERNVVLTDNGRVLGGGWATAQHWTDVNCYWDTSGEPMRFAGRPFAQWQAEGHDRQSIIADPLFEDAAHFDFRLKPDSPALALGFEPIDTSRIGLYGEKDWVNAPKRLSWEPVAIPTPPDPDPMSVSDDFEATDVGEPPEKVQIWGQSAESHIRVTDEKAASGKHSVKFTDARPARSPHEPEMAYRVSLGTGTAVCSYDVLLQPGSSLRNDLRARKNTDSIGSSLVFNGAGELIVAEKTLLTVPHGAWIHVAIQIGLGGNATGTYALAVTLPDGETRRFDDLPCVHKDFDFLLRVFFLSYSKGGASFHLDNIAIDTAE